MNVGATLIGEGLAGFTSYAALQVVQRCQALPIATCSGKAWVSVVSLAARLYAVTSP